MNAPVRNSGYLVEYQSVSGPNREHEVSVFGLGTVDFKPREGDGRYVVEVPRWEHVQAIMARNPPGEEIYFEPADLLTQAETEKIARVVDVMLEPYRALLADLAKKAGVRVPATLLDGPAHELAPKVETEAPAADAHAEDAGAGEEEAEGDEAEEALEDEAAPAQKKRGPKPKARK